MGGRTVRDKVIRRAALGLVAASMLLAQGCGCAPGVMAQGVPGVGATTPFRPLTAPTTRLPAATRTPTPTPTPTRKIVRARPSPTRRPTPTPTPTLTRPPASGAFGTPATAGPEPRTERRSTGWPAGFEHERQAADGAPSGDTP